MLIWLTCCRLEHLDTPDGGETERLVSSCEVIKPKKAHLAVADGF